MAVSFSNAINAYNSAVRSVTEGRIERPDTGMDAGQSFATMVHDSLKSSRDLGVHAEQMQMKALNGDADIRDVVLAVSNAEMALDTVVAVRDRVLTAYQEILKMPI